MFTVYILQSTKTKKYYVGQAGNLDERIKKHNAGRNKSTKFGLPWILIHTETYLTRSEATKREIEIKDYKGGIKFKKLLGLFEKFK